jgi:MarR family transcriptional regulator, organic hydroperoxide resistance regulator
MASRMETEGRHRFLASEAVSAAGNELVNAEARVHNGAKNAARGDRRRTRQTLKRGGDMERNGEYGDESGDTDVLVCGLLYQTFTAVFKETERALAPTGVSGPQAFALSCLKYGTPPMTPVRLASYLAQESQSLTGLLDRMENQGWIRRVRDLPDRRSLRIELTPAGDAKLQDADTAGRPAMKQALAGLSPEEIRQLGDLLERLRSSALQRLGLDPDAARVWEPCESVPLSV